MSATWELGLEVFFLVILVLIILVKIAMTTTKN